MQRWLRSTHLCSNESTHNNRGSGVFCGNIGFMTYVRNTSFNTPSSQHKYRRPCNIRGQCCCAHLESHRLMTANEYLIPGSNDLPRITEIESLVF
jgi:hypothetical protein